MRRIKIEFAYDGKNFSGFQVNPEKRTIQGTLQDALSKLLNEPIKIVASGRTDAGVHALAQTAHLDIPKNFTAIKSLGKSVNEILPPDIRVTSVKTVSDKFHARYNVKSKTYLYKCYVSAVSSPTREGLYAHVNSVLDLQKIKSATKLFVGKHNFKAFCSSGGDNETFEREVISIDVAKHGDELFFFVKGKGFLYNMVRLIVGSLIKVGQNKLSEGQIANALETGSKDNLGEKMPPHGLYLYKVEY